MFQYLSSGVIGSKLKGFGNPDLDWSTTRGLQCSHRTGLLQRPSDSIGKLLQPLYRPAAVGEQHRSIERFLTMTNNIGAISNKGVDVTLGFTPIQDFERQIRSGTSPSTVITTKTWWRNCPTKSKQNENNLNERNSPAPIYEEGKSTSINCSWCAPWELIRQPVMKSSWNATASGLSSGMPTTKWPWATPNRKFRGGITSSLTWKEWSLNLGFTYQLGAYIYNQTLVWTASRTWTWHTM